MEAVLQLDVGYMPMRVVSFQRAICLIYEGKADLVEQLDDRVVRSPSMTMPWPSVIRLRNYVHVPYKARNLALSTRAVLARDQHMCAYCGEEATTRDHIVPRSRGGKDEWMNVVAACQPCNASKNDLSLEEWGRELQFHPVIPSANHWVVIGMNAREQWQEYLTKA